MFMTLLLLLLCVLMASGHEKYQYQCPTICKCDMFGGLRRASCNHHHLLSIEAQVPSQVQVLDLSNNAISSVENHALKDLNMGKLVVFNISFNMLSDIAIRAFVGLEKLQVVDLSNNVLHILTPDIFESNVNLRRLYLRGNKFVSLSPGPILESKSLEVLDVGNCLISHLYPDTFSMLPSLSFLDISDNFLISIEVNVFENIPNIKEVNLVGNKWRCDVKIQELNLFLRNKRVVFQSQCVILEKSQKMILLEHASTERPNLGWDLSMDNCDIETVDETSHGTNATTRLDACNQIHLSVLVIVAFSVGVLAGLCVACTYVNCVHFMKWKRKRMRMRRPRDEFLLRDIRMGIGQSTPVLGRVRVA